MPNFRPTSNPNSTSLQVGMIDSLLLPGGEWNIPLLEQIFDRDSIDDPRCNGIKDETHLFFHCNATRAIWLASPWSVRWLEDPSLNLDSYLEWLSKPDTHLPVHPENTSKFFLFAAVILHTIWKLRNLFQFEGITCNLEEQVKIIYSKVDEFLATSSSPSGPPIGAQLTNPSWRPPPLGTIKINSDASVGHGNASLGLVVRDHFRKVLKVQVLREHIDIPEAAEAAAILRAVKLALEEGFLNLCCESDAKLIIQSLKNSDKCCNHWTAIGFIHKILDLCPYFESICFSWTPRQSNTLAHLASRWGLMNDNIGTVSPFTISSSFVEIMDQEMI
nr:uncharacterized protein LOC125421310 [Ziziphus jujuba var. spinosa]